MNKKKYKRKNTRRLVVIGMFLAIIIIMKVIPFLGFIPLPLGLNATTLHIPVIIAAIVEGPLVGIILGFCFGIMSLYNSYVSPTLLSFALMNPLVSVLPRILIGPIAYYIYKLIRIKNQNVKIIISALVGSLANTILVLSTMYLLYAKDFAKALNISEDRVIQVILGIVSTNGLAEAVVTACIAVPIIKAMLIFSSKK